MPPTIGHSQSPAPRKPSSASGDIAIAQTYRPDIDGLRAIAILLVIVFHAFPALVPGGFVGVDVFFVISGFLISGVIFQGLGNGSFSFIGFYGRRVRRIFPSLIVVLIACFLAGWFVLLTDEYQQLGKHIASSAGFVQNFVLWQEAGYFDKASELKPLVHLWSLAVEEQFYVLYPALIWCAWRLRVNILVTVAILGTVSLVLNVTGIDSAAIQTFYSPQTRFWELMAGAVLAALPFTQTAQRAATTNNLLSTVGFLLIALSAMALGGGKLFPGWWALLPVLGASLAICAGPQAWINRKILSHRVMVWIGLISYPLYLWHWPILSFIRILDGGTPSPALRMAALVISSLLAWLCYRFLERPIRFGCKAWWKTTLLCATLCLIGIVGYSTEQRKGFEFRYQALSLHETHAALPDPTTEDPECGKTNPEFVVAGYCAKTKPGTTDVLLMGDSHAGHLYHGIAVNSLATPHALSRLTKNGCLPFFDVASFEKGETDDCADFENKALTFVENTATIKTVILVTRGPLYLTGTGFGNALSEYKIERKLSLLHHPEVTDFKEVFRMGMENTVARLVAKNKQVIFVLDVPELDFDAKSCQTSPLPLRSAPRPVCAVSRAAYDARNRDYRALVWGMQQRFPTLKVFDAAAQLCDAQWCWAKRGDELLYTDTNHLTQRGSEFVAQALVKLIDQPSR